MRTCRIDGREAFLGEKGWFRLTTYVIGLTGGERPRAKIKHNQTVNLEFKGERGGGKRVGQSNTQTGTIWEFNLSTIHNCRRAVGLCSPIGPYESSHPSCLQPLSGRFLIISIQYTPTINYVEIRSTSPWMYDMNKFYGVQTTKTRTCCCITRLGLAEPRVPRSNRRNTVDDSMLRCFNASIVNSTAYVMKS